ncbi:cadherin-16 [Rhinatrema bivittatum]|uniref:cadherin-16 n=1 Tax=Rhinatrema bivittatum TaxID=194408 RepID=UPI00112B0D64|nr:cadherin-16 [Rhinatrema bivittatum]
MLIVCSTVIQVSILLSMLHPASTEQRVEVPENYDGSFPWYLTKINFAIEGQYNLELAGNDEGIFGIDEASGMLYATKSFDREQRAFYKLQVTAKNETGEALFGPVFIQIIIKDMNDNMPVMAKDMFSGTVSRGMRQGKSFMHVNATDLDDPSTTNGDLRYQIFSQAPKEPSENMFQIDAKTGGLSLTTEGVSLLCSAQVYKYNLVVQVKDMGEEPFGYHTFAKVEIEVVENTWTSPSPILIQENLRDTLPKIISRVNWISKEVHYYLEGNFPEDLYSIDLEGNYLLRKELDREVQSEYQIQVFAVNEDGRMVSPLEVMGSKGDTIFQGYSVINGLILFLALGVPPPLRPAQGSTIYPHCSLAVTVCKAMDSAEAPGLQAIPGMAQRPQQQQHCIDTLAATVEQLVSRLEASPPDPPPAPPLASISSSTSVTQLPATTRYAGDIKTCQGFLNQCYVRFTLLPAQFPSDAVKVAYIFSLLDGKALDWASPMWERQDPLLQNLQEFVLNFRLAFDDPARQTTATSELLHLRQGVHSVADYTIDFRTLAKEVGWRDDCLRGIFLEGLASRIKDELAGRDLPDDLNDLIDIAGRVDRRLQQRDKETRPYRRGPPLPPSTTRPAAPRIPPASAAPGEPMHVSPAAQLTAQQLQTLWQTTQDKLAVSASSAKRAADRHRRPAPLYQPGDRVWLSTKNIHLRLPSRRFALKFCGPFRVAERVGLVSYRLRLPSSLRIHDVFHVSLLKLLVLSRYHRKLPDSSATPTADDPTYQCFNALRLAEIGPEECSDHTMIWVEVQLGGPKPDRTRWRFPAYLSEDVGFRSFLQEKWREYTLHNTQHLDTPALFWEAGKATIRGTEIVQVTAEDADDPNTSNADIYYKIASQEPQLPFSRMFHIGEKTGMITLQNTALKTGIARQYSLRVMAVDLGGKEEGLSSTCTVVINVVDVNDSPPVFLKSQHGPFIVPEDTEIGMLIAILTVSDEDEEEEYKRVEFAIVSGNEDETFQIARVQQNGTVGVFLTKELDYEEVKEYSVIISVRNSAELLGAQYRLSSTATVHVLVENINEAPVFSTKRYEVIVPENLETGAVLVTVKAFDPDTNLTPSLSYTLRNDSKKYLSIDELSGEIQLTQALDRELEQGLYIVEVVAWEKDSPHVSAMAEVVIHLSDVNDNSPVLVGDYSEEYFCTPQQEGQAITLGAFDQDSMAQSTPFTFTLPQDPTIQRNWRINAFNDTHAQLSMGISWLEPKVHLVPITISDSGRPPQNQHIKLPVTICTCTAAGYCLREVGRMDGMPTVFSAVSIIVGTLGAIGFFLLIIFGRLFLLGNNKKKMRTTDTVPLQSAV